MYISLNQQMLNLVITKEEYIWGKKIKTHPADKDLSSWTGPGQVLDSLDSHCISPGHLDSHRTCPNTNFLSKVTDLGLWR